MPPQKKNTLLVEDWPKPKPGKLYNGKVKKVDIDRKAKSLHATVENLDGTQLGRIHEIALPLPIRPGNKTCCFLSACGFDANTIGTEVCLDDAIGISIGMVFGTTIENESGNIDFARISQALHTKPSASIEE